MWVVVLWLNIILAWITVEALESEPYYEYLFSRRNGYAYLEPLATSVYNDAQNSTVYIRNEHPRLLNTSSSDQDLQDLRQPDYELQSSGQSNYIAHRSKRSAYSDEMVPDKQLMVLFSLAKPDEVLECVLDTAIMIGCNYCVCMGGQLYVCTARQCHQQEHEQEKLLRSNLKQRNMNNHPECIEGQNIRSFDRCNRCYCGGGQVLCTRKICDAEHANRKECRPGDKIPSPDGCNVCACNTRGHIVCTVKTCGAALSPNIQDMGCTPNTWFSTTGDSHCKECYCVNGKTSFCYMNLCTNAKQIRRTMLKNSIQTIPGTLPDKCRRLDYMQDQCTKCYCNESRTWICRTENTKKCARKVPIWGKNLNKRPRHRPPKDYYYGRPKRRPPKGKTPIRSTKPHTPSETHKPTTSIIPTTETLEDKKDWTQKKPPAKTTKYITIPEITTTTVRIEEESRTSHHTTTEEPYIIEPSQIPPLDNFDLPSEESYNIKPSKVPSDNFDPPDEELFTIEPTKPVQSTKNNQPEHLDVLPPKTNVNPKENQPDSVEDFPSLDVDGYRPSTNAIPHDPHEGDVDTNVDRAPYCRTGQYITQSTNYNCLSCLCSSSNEWKCWSVKGACQAQNQCNPGRLRKNSKSACSVCYCGADHVSYCATDAACRFLIKPTKCEAVACMDKCTGSLASLGICYQDRCMCIA